jgi:hypothetical protein
MRCKEARRLGTCGDTPALTTTTYNRTLNVLYNILKAYCRWFPPGHATMSGNKKSTLTGYIPDILMAAAAVRFSSHKFHTCAARWSPYIH